MNTVKLKLSVFKMTIFILFLVGLWSSPTFLRLISSTETNTVIEAKQVQREETSKQNSTGALESFDDDNYWRKQRIANVCKNFNEHKYPNALPLKLDNIGDMRTIQCLPDQFTTVPEKKIAWCRTAEAGTIPLTKIFLQLYGVSKLEDNVREQARQIEETLITYEDKWKLVNALGGDEDTDYKGVIVGRHPIDRLYSAHQELNQKSGQKKTFAEFLKEVAETDNLLHSKKWKANWRLCNPCLYHYKYIFKIETFERDIEALLHQIGSDSLDLTWMGQEKRSIEHLNYEKILEDVDQKTLKFILWIYKLDFLLFDYDIKQIEDILATKQ